MILTAESALSKIVGEFSRRDWRDRHDVALDIVRHALRMDSHLDPSRLAASAPTVFLSVNGISRRDLAEALCSALRGVDQIIAGQSDSDATGSDTVIIARDYVKKTTINNYGQFAGNVDSPDAKVSVGKQQQMTPNEAYLLLKPHFENPEVIDVLSSPMDDNEKTRKIARIFSRASGVAIDVATAVAARLISDSALGG